MVTPSRCLLEVASVKKLCQDASMMFCGGECEIVRAAMGTALSLARSPESTLLFLLEVIEG